MVGGVSPAVVEEAREGSGREETRQNAGSGVGREEVTVLPLYLLLSCFVPSLPGHFKGFQAMS